MPDDITTTKHDGDTDASSALTDGAPTPPPPSDEEQQKDTIFNQKLNAELDATLADIEYREIEEDTQAAAKKQGLSYLNLVGYPIQLRSLFLLNEGEARTAQVAILRKEGKDLSLAVHDPAKPETKAIIDRFSEKHTVHIILVSLHSLNYVWKRYEQQREKEEVKLSDVTIEETFIDKLRKEIKTTTQVREHVANVSVKEMVDIFVGGALALDASDLHIEPTKENVRLRYRIDGILVDVLETPRDTYEKLLARIKLHSHMKINVHARPQDGRFHVTSGNRQIEIRTSVLPSPSGESVVMRILDPAAINKKLEDLGMREDTLVIIKRLLEKKTGILFNTGPTGSGKTTSLYAFIRYINHPDVKIITLEDPIEYKINGVVQTQVDEKAGYTFAEGLRSIVRQDPDIILVGEVRDLETASMTGQAALTGHLVFSTIHANSAASAIPRLIDLGMKAVTIAPALNASMAQRLVRRLCECAQLQTITPEHYQILNMHVAQLPKATVQLELSPDMKIKYPNQCEKCNYTGYKGRIGIYEVLEIDDEMRHLIATKPLATDIEKAAIKKGMITILQDGLLKAIHGTTSIDEVLRVVGL